jgi:hypothetical protein
MMSASSAQCRVCVTYGALQDARILQQHAFVCSCIYIMTYTDHRCTLISQMGESSPYERLARLLDGKSNGTNKRHSQCVLQMYHTVLCVTLHRVHICAQLLCSCSLPCTEYTHPALRLIPASSKEDGGSIDAAEPHLPAPGAATSAPQVPRVAPSARPHPAATAARVAATTSFLPAARVAATTSIPPAAPTSAPPHTTAVAAPAISAAVAAPAAKVAGKVVSTTRPPVTARAAALAKQPVKPLPVPVAAVLPGAGAGAPWSSHRWLLGKLWGHSETLQKLHQRHQPWLRR